MIRLLARALALAALAIAASTTPATAAPASTAAQTATVKVTANLRSQPNTSSRIIRVMPTGTVIDVECWATGEPTYGTDRYGSMWLYSPPGWVHSYLVTPVDVPECDLAELSGLLDSGWSYQNCDQARELGAAPVYSYEPGYAPHLDRDGDGVGCEGE